jgi:hypothetical protein
VAVKASDKSSQATIPVSIQTTGNSREAQALIPVEVQSATGKSVKRAAVVPVRVRTSTKSRKKARRPSSQARRRTHTNLSRAERARQLELIKQSAQRENYDLLTKSVVVLTTAEETLVNMTGNLAKVALQAVPRFLQAGVRLPFVMAGNTADKAQQIYGEAKDFAQDLAA